MCECINDNISKYHSKIPVNKRARIKKYIWVTAKFWKWLTLWGHKHCFATANGATCIRWQSSLPRLILWFELLLPCSCEIFDYTIWKFTNTFIKWVTDNLINLKHFDEMKSIGKIKLMKSMFYGITKISKLFFTNTISFCHFSANPTKSAFIGYFTRTHNL